MLNKVLTKKEVSNIIDTVYRFCGQKETVLFLRSNYAVLVLDMLLLQEYLLVKMI